VSDVYRARRGHADSWRICLAHQLRDLRHAVEAGGDVFAPRPKVLLLRAVLLARRRLEPKASSRLPYRRRLERELTAILALQPTSRHGRRPRQRYLAVRDSLLTFLQHPAAPPDNYGAERDLRPMAMYRKATGGFRSSRGPDLCAAIKSVVGTAARHAVDAYHAIPAVLSAGLSSIRVEQLPKVSLSFMSTANSPVEADQRILRLLPHASMTSNRI
jgi:transposase